MMFTNIKTKFVLPEKEVNEALCTLIIFCNMNKNSKQAGKLNRKLKQMEKAVNAGKFKN